MSEPRAEQIAAGIVTLLGAIVSDGGATTTYSCDKAVRAAAFGSACLDTSVDKSDAGGPTIYVFVPDRIERRQATNREVDCVLFGDLVLAKGFTPPNENPLTPPVPSRSTVQLRMSRDVEKKLLGDLTTTIQALGTGAWNVEVSEWDVSPENTFIDGWAIAFGRLLVTYRYVRDTP